MERNDEILKETASIKGYKTIELIKELGCFLYGKNKKDSASANGGR
jgi:hypothetical protein